MYLRKTERTFSGSDRVEAGVSTSPGATALQRSQLAVLRCDVPRQADDTGPRRSVQRAPEVSEQAAYRCRIHDRASVAERHLRQRRLRRSHDAAQIEVEHLVEIAEVHVQQVEVPAQIASPYVIDQYGRSFRYRSIVLATISRQLSVSEASKRSAKAGAPSRFSCSASRSAVAFPMPAGGRPSRALRGLRIVSLYSMQQAFGSGTGQ